MGAVDRAGALEWVAIALAFVAVLVILRYGSRPRCEHCRRRHHRRPVDAVPMTTAGSGTLAVATPLPDPGRKIEIEPGQDDLDLDLEIDLTTDWQPDGAVPEPAGLELIAISWRADQHGVRTWADVEATA